MADLLPEDDTAPPADPFEAELVAYLDGELEPAAARKVEARLASDPQARSRATALKKTFDLLDYLPKPEPSAEFTSRTLDKLPALQQGSPQPQPVSVVSPSPPKAQRTSHPAVAALVTPRASHPELSRPLTALKYLAESNHSKTWMWALGILIAMTGFVAAGYFGGSAFRSNRADSQSVSNKEVSEDLTLSDRHLIENLPLYVAVDDFDFIKQLAKTEYFGDDPTVTYDSTLKVPSIPREGPSDVTFENLQKAFKTLSPERQQAIREIDKSLASASPSLKNRLTRVLEAYSGWLNSLADDERNGILKASDAMTRLNKIRQIRDRQWSDSLAVNLLNKLNTTQAESDLRRRLLIEWKAEENRRREEWASARKTPSETLDTSKIPWPFENEKTRNEVLAFAKVSLRLDDTKEGKGSRLTANELDRYQWALNFAQSQGGAAWQLYGKILYELVKKQEDYLLPPPGDAKLRYVDFPDLPSPYLQFPTLLNRLKSKATPYVGKWPEFPLEIHKDVLQIHLKDAKSFNPKTLTQLGPVKLADFTSVVRDYLQNELLSKLSDVERRNLTGEQGKWPEYSREIVRLARSHDLSIPGVMLPGSQKQWEATYSTNRSK